MRPAFAALEDTIVALATPPGRSALALVRVSGPRSADMLRSIASGLPAVLPVRHPRLAVLRDESGAPIDRALVTFFAGPDSATGEDLAEISVHGSPAIVEAVLERLRGSGARPARPGEFTERAFLLGKLDLVEAEAVRDLVAARTDEAAKASMRRLDGGLSRRLSPARESLARAAAELAAAIDFAEDVGETVAPSTVAAIGAAADELARLAATAQRGRLLSEGARVVLLGRPNAGKSTLFNALVGSARAIVTEVPGTTRDTLDAAIDVEGIPVELVDTAGLRETDDRVERLGVDRAREAAAASDAILYVFDASAGLTPEDRSSLSRLPSERLLLVANKIDRADGFALSSLPEGAVRICGIGPDAGPTLAARLVSLLGAGPPGETLSEVLGSVRQRDLVSRAAAAARDAADGLERAESPEYPAARLDEALSALSDLFGETTTEDVLRRVFATFCIGK